MLAPEFWSSTSGVTIDASTLSIVGADGPTGSGLAGVSHQTTAQCLAAGATVSFDWSFNSGDVDGAFFDPGFYINGNLVGQLTDDNGSNNQSGSFSFDCAGGDAIGFAVITTDGILGAGYLTITNFTIVGANGGCTYPGEFYDCDGNCTEDADAEGICDDEDDCVGAYDD